MALSGSALTPLVVADYFAAFPSASGVIRSNPSTGVAPHSPPAEMVSAICSGFASALSTMSVADAYVGVVGATAQAAAVVPIFNAGVIQAEKIAALATLQWAGPQAATLIHVLLDSFFTRVSTITSIQMPPIPGAGTGLGAVSPLVNPSLPAAMSAACYTAMVSEFTASGYFGIDDVPTAGLTPQITAIISALATSYGNIVGSITAPTVYTGAASGSALTFTNVGTFI